LIIAEKSLNRRKVGKIIDTRAALASLYPILKIAIASIFFVGDT